MQGAGKRQGKWGRYRSPKTEHRGRGYRVFHRHIKALPPVDTSNSRNYHAKWSEGYETLPTPAVGYHSTGPDPCRKALEKVSVTDPSPAGPAQVEQRRPPNHGHQELPQPSPPLIPPAQSPSQGSGQDYGSAVISQPFPDSPFSYESRRLLLAGSWRAGGQAAASCLPLPGSLGLFQGTPGGGNSSARGTRQSPSQAPRCKPRTQF